MLYVEHLSVSFHSRLGITQAVDDISLAVESGGITALIGESGSGKSVACYSLLGLLPTPPARLDAGTALFKGRDLLKLSNAEMRHIRGRDIAMVFQDPMTCLNPYMTIGKQLVEPMVHHQGASAAVAMDRATALLAEVGFHEPDTALQRYPHHFSGGMRQRVMIAMALINEPSLLIADEPTTALDVTIQAQILRLLADLQRSRDLGILFISHDLAVVADIADDILVMREGRIVERGDPTAIFQNAKHPYTQKLLSAIPTGQKATLEQPREPLIEVDHLRTWFHQGKTTVKAVDDVSFTIHRGEILGLVGESGSGKSTIGRSILQLQHTTGGEVRFDGKSLGKLDRSALTAMRKRMQIIFQDPFASLNPRMTVYDTLAEPLLLHRLEDRSSVNAAVLRLMDSVGLSRQQVRKYPHEFSGGQRQRIAIGRALATRPEFVVADEPVSALDVTIQAQILDLLEALVKEYGLTLLFISHDLAVVRQLADRIVVLQGGKIVEEASAQQLFDTPQQAYTQQLLAATPGQSLRQ
ncbi:MAG: ABC transporter ATP-binding protein [Pseudomonadota bacterium]